MKSKLLKSQKKLPGVIDVGDIGIVVDKYDDKNFEIECGKEDGSYKWLEPLNNRYFKLRRKDPNGIRKK
jgi:hypothetical protein